MLPGKGILLCVILILSASFISFSMFFGRNPHRCKTQNTKPCISKCNHIFKQFANLKLNTWKRYNKFIKGTKHKWKLDYIHWSKRVLFFFVLICFTLWYLRIYNTPVVYDMLNISCDNTTKNDYNLVTLTHLFGIKLSCINCILLRNICVTNRIKWQFNEL